MTTKLHTKHDVDSQVVANAGEELKNGKSMEVCTLRKRTQLNVH